jgi:hypothetical protein
VALEAVEAAFLRTRAEISIAAAEGALAPELRTGSFEYLDAEMRQDPFNVGLGRDIFEVELILCGQERLRVKN